MAVHGTVVVLLQWKYLGTSLSGLDARARTGSEGVRFVLVKRYATVVAKVCRRFWDLKVGLQSILTKGWTGSMLHFVVLMMGNFGGS